MITPRSLLLLAAVLATAAAASSHAPSRFGFMKPQTTTKPPATTSTTTPQPAANNTTAQNITADMQEVMTQMAAIMVPRIQAKLRVLLGNIGRALSGAVFATFRTGFKVPLTATFVPMDMDKAESFGELESYPPGYHGEPESWMKEPLDSYVTEERRR